jgi:hypothetical protein
MGKLALLIAAVVGIVWSVAASAAPITVYTDRSQYEAAVAANPDFTSTDVPLTSFVNPPELNITSSSGLNPVNVTSIGGVSYLSNQHNVATDTLNIAPAGDVRALAFDYFLGNPGGTPGTLNGLITLNGSVVSNVTNVSGAPAVAFFGVISDSPIASLIFARTGTGGFQANQVEFINSISYATVAAAPVPPALPLFISALGGLGLIGWRRSKATMA